MRPGLDAIGAALGQISRNWFRMVVANVTAALLSVPVIGVAVVFVVVVHSVASLTITIVLALVVGALPNPMAAGLHFLVHEVTQREMISLGEQWEGLRHFWILAFRAWTLSLLGVGVIVGNIAFYGRFATPLTSPLRITWLCVLAVWLSMHVYVYPLLITQEIKHLRLVYRNAFIMVMSRPAFTLVVLVIWLAVLVIATGTGLAVVLGLAVAAAIQHNATAVSLATFRVERQ